MIDTIYVEDGVREHPRVGAIVERFAGAEVIACRHYGEIFNPGGQDFRLQKRRPALILARKKGNLVLDAPPGFGIGGERNYYFSHMLNCLYDCRYCFLQGMFRSAHYVLFVNFEDFEEAIDEQLAAAGGGPSCFFSGYDCDSLALESMTGFVRRFVPFFARRPTATLELRTKSVGVRHFSDQTAVPNVVVAFSFTPAAAAAAIEHGAPTVAARIDAAAALAAAGWPIGIRLDPLLWYEGWRHGYDSLVDDLAAAIPGPAVHSVSIGPLRFPRAMFQRIERMYPDVPLLSADLVRRHDAVSYGADREHALADAVQRRLSAAFPAAEIFSCAAAT